MVAPDTTRARASRFVCRRSPFPDQDADERQRKCEQRYCDRSHAVTDLHSQPKALRLEGFAPWYLGQSN